ncbi:MAG: hypothetical protein R3E66_00550 [bacterium]
MTSSWKLGCLEEVKATGVGPPSEDPDMGPMCFLQNNWKSWKQYAADARGKGATISFGGND